VAGSGLATIRADCSPNASLAAMMSAISSGVSARQSRSQPESDSQNAGNLDVR
jgi:hypothetical protein